jgi:hypothetical protein
VLEHWHDDMQTLLRSYPDLYFAEAPYPQQPMIEVAIRCDFFLDIVDQLYSKYSLNLQSIQIKNGKIELVKGKNKTDVSFIVADAFKSVYPSLCGELILMCMRKPKLLAHGKLLNKLQRV